MKVLLSWLNEFAPLGDDAERLGEVMSDLGMAVEEMTPVGEGLDGVVIARILDIAPIEGADRIRAVTVDAGGGEPVPVVCGAWNISVDDVVPFATVGTQLPGGMEIKARKMKGAASQGMLCSTRELGLGDDHDGIWLLDQSFTPGTDLRDAIGMSRDVRFDLEINPNRPDAMSVAGVARDCAARLGVPFERPLPEVAGVGAPASDAVHVEILDADLCGRFHASVLRGVQVGSSPQWMANRLAQLGMRPINALVDISNYVMLELGQPNHPYDLDRVPGAGLRIRRARPGEVLVTLDDVERALERDDLLICAADDTPVGIAGVMGGASCEISAATTDVLVENAWFLPMSISRTSRRLGLRTEASARFERGCDPEVLELAAARFAQLAGEICGARARSRRGRGTGRAPGPVGCAGAAHAGERAARYRDRRSDDAQVARPDRVRLDRRRRRDVLRCDSLVAVRLSDRDRRRRGDRPDVRLHEDRAAAVDGGPRGSVDRLAA